MSKFVSRSPEQTQEFAAEFARSLQRGDVVALHGDLGSGKTCFVQGLAMGLGVSDLVSSPTYLILHEYSGGNRLNHIDLYRLKTPGEVLAFGFDECIDSGAVTAIEWPEIATEFLPPKTYHVRLEYGLEPDSRAITVERG